MSVPFDPYYKWLGIPPEDQPPNHYRLLGIKEYESNADVIESAADRQMAHVRTFQSGQHAALSQMVLNELSSARLCLLNAASKTSYDTVLRSAVPVDAMLPPPAEPAAPPLAPPAEDDRLGTAFGAYELIERTGGGQFGRVYKARDQQSGRFCSVKILPRDAVQNAEVVKRFQREIDITTKLDHPNLIVGLGAGEHDGQKYLVTEYVMGTDVATLVQQQGPLSPEQATAYIIGAARGLTQLHLHRVYHRNLKPHVLTVDVQGNVKVTNLFLARVEEGSGLVTDEELTRMGQTMGTYDYLPPEQAANAHSADARSDIYSLGCTLFFLLTGQPPYPHKSPMEKLRAHQQDPIPSLCAARNDVPPTLDRVFQKMAAKDPAARYQFMGDLLKELEAIQKKPSWFQRIRHWLSKR